MLHLRDARTIVNVEQFEHKTTLRFKPSDFGERIFICSVNVLNKNKFNVLFKVTDVAMCLVNTIMTNEC
jgi:hypothetical protein